LPRLAPSRIAHTRIAAAAALLACAACGGPPPPDPNRKATFPVSGKVLVGDRPLARAVVTFHPLDDAKGARAYARTDAEGAFSLSTYEIGDGAPAGRYAVSVLQDADAAAAPASAAYANPKTSGLIVEVKPETNELPPFHLRP
jgi:hypothetical protein